MLVGSASQSHPISKITIYSWSTNPIKNVEPSDGFEMLLSFETTWADEEVRGCRALTWCVAAVR
jgi:hypothetical protein